MTERNMNNITLKRRRGKCSVNDRREGRSLSRMRRISQWRGFQIEKKKENIHRMRSGEVFLLGAKEGNLS
jgi:hypothetical protein